MSEAPEMFMYRDIPIVFRHYFGWQYMFKFEDYLYYAFYIELDQAREGAKRQIDNLYLKKEVYDE